MIKTGVEVVKSGVGAVLNGTSNASIPATNATSELVSNSTVAVFKNVTQPVLEIKPEKTTTVAMQKDESVNEDDDEDEAEKAIKTKPKEIDPSEKEHHRREKILLHSRLTSFSWTNSQTKSQCRDKKFVAYRPKVFHILSLSDFRYDWQQRVRCSLHG